MTDYSDGNWHGWSELANPPIHPESRIDQVWHDEKTGRAGVNFARKAGFAAWGQTLKFRVVTPYVEPATYSGNCWAYHYTHQDPSTASHNAGGNCVHGTWTAEHVDGKLRRFSWEADE